MQAVGEQREHTLSQVRLVYVQGRSNLRPLRRLRTLRQAQLDALRRVRALLPAVAQVWSFQAVKLVLPVRRGRSQEDRLQEGQRREEESRKRG